MKTYLYFTMGRGANCPPLGSFVINPSKIFLLQINLTLSQIYLQINPENLKLLR